MQDCPWCITGASERRRDSSADSISPSGGGGLNAAHVTECDCAIADAVAPDAESCVIEKSRHSAFFKTSLEELLRKMNRDQVFVCGVFAHHGVMVSTIDG